jgi:hypothetical protein
MALPFIAIGGHLLGGIASSGLHAAIDGFLGPLKRAVSYDANIGNSNLILGPNEIIEAYIRTVPSQFPFGRNQENPGQQAQIEYEALLARHGISLLAGGQPDINGVRHSFPAWWKAHVNSKMSPPPLEVIIALRQLGRLNDYWWERWIARYAVVESEAKDRLLNMPFVFTPEQSRILYRLTAAQGDGWPTIGDNQEMVRRLAAAGMPDARDQTAFQKLIQPPTYHECIQLLNRDLLAGTTDAERRREFNRLMTLEGFTDPQIIDYLHELRKEIPTPADLIAMSVKNVFDKHLSATLKLDDEYEEQPQYIVWTDRTGFTGDPTVSREDMRRHLLSHRSEQESAGQQVETVEETTARADRYYEAQDRTLRTWAQAHWREHWVNLSPSQIYTGLHRCRPIDSTRPGGRRAQLEYEADLRALEARGPEANTVEARYAIAQRYSSEFGRVLTVPGSNDPVPPVTMDIVRTVLRANDYAPLFRDTLASISYNTLRLVDIRRIVQVSLRNEAFARQAIGYAPPIDNGGPIPPPGQPQPTGMTLPEFVQAWAKEQYLDRGQTPEAAQSLSVLAIQSGRTTNSVIASATNPAGRRRWVRLLERAYRVGVISLDNFNMLIGQVDTVVASDEVFADVFAEEDIVADDYVQSQLTAYNDLLTAEDYADDAVSEELDNVS